MQTVTLQFDAENQLIKSILHAAVLAGAELIEFPNRETTVREDPDVLAAYQKMFGKRKGNKYTENEIFIFNSKLNASKSFAKYL